MWSISVEPTPSRITRSCLSRHRCQTSAGSGSAAETHSRADEKSPSLLGREHGVVERRHREEQRGAEPLDRREDRVRARTTAQEDGRRAGPVGEGEVVAEAVRMEELRRRERDVLIGDAEDVPCVRLAGDEKVSMQVDDALGATGGARAVEPERHVVAERVDRLELLRRLELVDEQQLRRTHLLCAHRIDDRQPRACSPRRSRGSRRPRTAG